ncbi:hypothetical protein ACFFX0_19570 [Citricoccus parietis]|uniref:Secreted protein n=2 Tax=Citricoccus parietis TaxID=592307 RepID=A0ABV5G2W2_9MICC
MRFRTASMSPPSVWYTFFMFRTESMASPSGRVLPTVISPSGVSATPPWETTVPVVAEAGAVEVWSEVMVASFSV